MNVMKYLPHPGIIAILVIAMMVIEPLIPKFLVSWIAFMTWALYFIAGGTPKQGVKAAACFIGGVLAAILIMVLANATAATLGKATLPLVCAAVAFVVICFEKFKPLDFIPAWFIGAGAFFALANVQGAKFEYGPATLTVVSAMAFGMVWGFMTVVLRTKYGAWLEKSAAPAPKAGQ